MIVKLSEQQKNWVLNTILSLMKSGNGRVYFVVQDHKLLDKVTEKVRERMTEGKTQAVNKDGLGI